MKRRQFSVEQIVAAVKQHDLGVSPTDKARIESLNGPLRDECLNVYWFDDLTDARKKLQAWQREYNETRPHRSLNELSPQEFKALWVQQTSEIH